MSFLPFKPETPADQSLDQSTAPADETSSSGASPAPSTSAEPARERAVASPINDPMQSLKLKPRIIEAISTVYDPEIPVNIYELGLIYDVTVTSEAVAHVQMTLTAPNCPAAQTLPAEVGNKVRAVEGVSDARVDVVWEPPWDKDKMSEAAKLQLGLF